MSFKSRPSENSLADYCTLENSNNQSPLRSTREFLHGLDFSLFFEQKSIYDTL